MLKHEAMPPKDLGENHLPNTVDTENRTNTAAMIVPHFLYFAGMPFCPLHEKELAVAEAIDDSSSSVVD